MFQGKRGSIHPFPSVVVLPERRGHGPIKTGHRAEMVRAKGQADSTSGGGAGVKLLALAGALIFSAYLTAAALRSPDHHWLAWISFLPLFVAVRWLRPATAALVGGLWGACLYVFLTAGPTPVVEAMALAMDPTAAAITPSASLLALLIVVPAVYVGLAARPARCGTGILPVSSAIKLLTLALGWTLVEAVLHFHHPSALREGLLSGSQGEATQLHWLARLFGYVCTAFVVACVNASLIGILSNARLGLPAGRSLAEPPNAGVCPASQTTLCFQLLALSQTCPRAPPAMTEATTR